MSWYEWPRVPECGTLPAMTEHLADTTLREIAPDLWWRHAWSVAEARYRLTATLPTTSEAALRRELLFCLLGGHGISYELNRSATEVLWRRGLFRHWRPLSMTLTAELSRAQFEPPRKDGSFRRYRFPARKAAVLVQAGAW